MDGWLNVSSIRWVQTSNSWITGSKIYRFARYLYYSWIRLPNANLFAAIVIAWQKICPSIERVLMLLRRVRVCVCVSSWAPVYFIPSEIFVFRYGLSTVYYRTIEFPPFYSRHSVFYKNLLTVNLRLFTDDQQLFGRTHLARTHVHSRRYYITGTTLESSQSATISVMSQLRA